MHAVAGVGSCIYSHCVLFFGPHNGTAQVSPGISCLSASEAFSVLRDQFDEGKLLC